MRKMNLGALAVLVLLISLAGWVGTQYPKSAKVIGGTPTPAYWGYPCTPLAVGIVQPVTPYPAPGEAQKTMQAQMTPIGVRAVASPTSEWLQPGRDIPCDRLGALVEAAMNYRYEALWASELQEPHVVRARHIEPGAQLTRIHQVGSYYIILFEQALIVWRDNDARILVASPVNGCWLRINVPTPSNTSISR